MTAPLTKAIGGYRQNSVAVATTAKEDKAILDPLKAGHERGDVKALGHADSKDQAPSFRLKIRGSQSTSRVQQF